MLRHDEPLAVGGFPPATLTEKQMSLVEAHVKKYVGPFKNVLHEIISEGIHLDVLPVEPSKKFPYRAFVTMGMSAIPMNIDEGVSARAELCVVLPADWPVDKALARDENDDYYWPILWLKNLARLPSDFDTYLDTAHTVPNGDPPEPFTPGCKFVGWLVIPPFSMPDPFFELKAPRFNVHFFQIVPLYKEEMDLKLEEGFDALLQRFQAAELNIEDMCDPKRPNAAMKK